MNVLRQPLVQRLLAVGLGLVFVYASYDKIWKHDVAAPATTEASGAGVSSGPEAFARIVYRYQVVGPDATFPPVVANFVAVTLPWVELLAGLLLIAGVWRREAAVVVALLLVVFVAAVGSTLVRGIDIENCGCFSVASEGRGAGMPLIVADVVLLAAAAVVAFVRPRLSLAQFAASPEAAELARLASLAEDSALTAPPPDA